MPTVSYKIEGLDAVINFTKQVTIRMPKEANKLNEKLAKNTQNMAKRFLKRSYSKRRSVPPTGELRESILAFQQRPTEWRVKMGPTSYMMAQEYGHVWEGRRFIPKAGYGNTKEGFSIKDPNSSIVVKGKHFMQDAVEDTKKVADKMVEEAAKEILK